MNDPELESWGQAWRQQPAVLADLRARTVREHRRLVLWIAADALAVLALGALSANLLLNAGDVARQLAGIVMGIITVGCGVFLALNWRGSFTQVAESARDHLALQRRRALAKLNYARFSWVLMALQFLLVAAILWLRLHEAPPRPPKPAALAVLAVAFIVACGVTLWLQRSARRRLQNIDELARTLEDA
jgi:uncharacterized membrane protein